MKINRPFLFQAIVAFVFFSLSTFNVFSQIISDDFSDGDFTASPTWSGDDAVFTVNASNQLQLNNTVADQSALSTSFTSSSLNNREWRFYFKQGFSGSDNNQSRLYFAASAVATEYTGSGSAGATGYFLKLGEAGTSDVIRIYKDDGAITTELAACTTIFNSSSNNQAGIKITRDDAGNWEVLIDATGGTNYVSEATFTDNSYNTSAAINWICTYTASNGDAFFLDDIYFGEIVIDATPPQLISATATSASMLDVMFDEAVSTATCEDENNYEVLGFASPSSAVRDAGNHALVHLTFAASFVENVTQTLEVQNIEDEAGNALTNAQTEFLWFVAAAPEYRSVVFNEVLADPTPLVGLPDAEYVEIFNASNEAYDLSGWQFVNTTTVKTLTSFILEPNEYVVLCDVNLASQFTNAIGISSPSALTNTTDSLTLLDNNGNVIDVLVYNIDWFATSEKADGGWSLEQVNPFYPCANNANNWSESSNANGGTPAAQNSVYNNAPDTTPPTIISVSPIDATHFLLQFSEAMDIDSWANGGFDLIPFNSVSSTVWSANGVSWICTTDLPLNYEAEYQILNLDINDCAGNAMLAFVFEFIFGLEPQLGDLIINEIYPDPNVSASFPFAEYVELYNKGNHILNLQGVMLNSGIIEEHTILYPDSLIVLADDANGFSFFGLVGAKTFLTSFPSLTNGGLELTLKNLNEDILDLVHYDISWYQNTSKDDGGWSLELVNPFLPCSGIANWKASEAGIGGTPALQNSIYDETPDTISPNILSISPIDETHFFIQFSEPLDTSTWANTGFGFDPFNSVSSTVWNQNNDGWTCTTDQTLFFNETYSIVNLALSDCSGNAMQLNTYTFTLGHAPTVGDIIINEIYAQPTGNNGIPDAEYVELYNASENVINLQGVMLENELIEQHILIYPDSFLVLADVENNFEFSAFNGDVVFLQHLSLTDGGMNLELKDANEIILDQVNYNTFWYHDLNKDGGGWSLELINPNDPCSNEDNWRASVNARGGTPAERNSVYSIAPDITPPQLLYVLSEPINSVTLVFNEPIDETSLSNLTWTVNGEVQNISNAHLANDDGTWVSIFYGTMTAGVVYTFDLSGIQDCWGNESVLIQNRFALPETAQPGDIIINEILYNPYENGKDFIEIYNNSLRNISIAEWKLSKLDAISTRTITELQMVLLSGEYLILTEDGTDLIAFYPDTKTNRIFRVEDMPDFPSEDAVFIALPDSIISDAVFYNDAAHFPLLNSFDGVSLERIAFNRPSADITNWHSASELVGFATPGYQNSQSNNNFTTEQSFEVVNEIFSPDNDGFQDVVTFAYNLDEPGYTGNITIYDSEGRHVKKLMQNDLLGLSGSISWDGFNDEKQKASIGIYVVYFEVFNLKGDVSKFKKTCVVAHQLD